MSIKSCTSDEKIILPNSLLTRITKSAATYHLYHFPSYFGIVIIILANVENIRNLVRICFGSTGFLTGASVLRWISNTLYLTYA